MGCLIIAREPGLGVRLFVAMFLLTMVLVPLTSQFWIHALPIVTWLLLWNCCKFIDPEYRPKIFVRVLPALETILFGGNLSEVLASTNNAALDLLAWIPYGLVHFGAPFVIAAILFLFAPPKTLPVFGFAFGWMNLIGVIIQLSFPTAPPWYQKLHGLDPANYSMPGSAGGLARVDQLLGLNLYTGSFGASPLVFGAFPSLHSGSAVMEALFMSYLFPKFMPAFFAYVLWIWWSTMYLTHHYFIDLIGGAALSFCVFYACKLTVLPRIQRDRFGRWSYDFIEVGVPGPTKARKSMDEYIELPPIDTSMTNHEEDGTNMTMISSPYPYLPHKHSHSVSVNYGGHGSHSGQTHARSFSTAATFSNDMIPSSSTSTTANNGYSSTSPSCSTSPSHPPSSSSGATSPMTTSPLAKFHYHNHHKTSSIHLYDGDLRATSASSPVMTMRPEFPLYDTN